MLSDGALLIQRLEVAYSDITPGASSGTLDSMLRNRAYSPVDASAESSGGVGTPFSGLLPDCRPHDRNRQSWSAPRLETYIGAVRAQ